MYVNAWGWKEHGCWCRGWRRRGISSSRRRQQKRQRDERQQQSSTDATAVTGFFGFSLSLLLSCEKLLSHLLAADCKYLRLPSAAVRRSSRRRDGTTGRRKIFRLLAFYRLKRERERERETGPVPASPRSAACMPGTSFSLVRQTRGLCRRRTGLRAGRDECAVSQPETAVHAIAPCFDPKTETDTGVHVPSGRFFLLLLLAKLLLVASHPSQR